MTIYSVHDPEFIPYGRVITGLEETVSEILPALAQIPLPDGTGYVPTEPLLQDLPAADVMRDHCFGGMPVELGWCCGHNRSLNCLEYHRDSEFNLGTEEFILLLARQEEITDGFLDTAKVKAFLVPAGTLIEVYATTLHYAPCCTENTDSFRVLIVLPWGTNTDIPQNFEIRTPEDQLLTARNKWLLAHPDVEHWTRKRQLEEVHRAGGAVIQAHPFRDRDYIKYILLGRKYCDGIEVANMGNHPYCDACATQYAREYGFLTTAGSDNHNWRNVNPAKLMGVALEERLTSVMDYAKLILSRGPIRPVIPEGWLDVDPEQAPRLLTYWIDEDDPDMRRIPTNRDFMPGR